MKTHRGHVSRRAARRIVRGVAFVAVVLAAQVWVSVWVAATFIALAAMAGFIMALAAFEDWVFDRGRRPGSRLGVMPVRGGGEIGDHVGFARALAAVAAAYLAECERETRP